MKNKKEKTKKKNTKWTTELFIEKAKAVHGARYDYSETIYTKTSEKVIIVCNKHGAYNQLLHNHLNGQGCPACSNELKAGRNEEARLRCAKAFVRRAMVTHGDTYDYSETFYISTSAKLKISCRMHGCFTQLPHDHLRGCGCPECGIEKKTSSASFLKRARAIHGDKYDYSNVMYKNMATKVNIIGLII